jgi:RNA polymerase sigma factor (sigma-70 family)
VTVATTPAPGSITELIHRANQGEQDALNRLFTELYSELHDMARSRVRRHAPITVLQDALEQLAAADERLVRLVEMRYFGGLTEDEIAEALGVSSRTVQRDWEKARLLPAIALK